MTIDHSSFYIMEPSEKLCNMYKHKMVKQYIFENESSRSLRKMFLHKRYKKVIVIKNRCIVEVNIRTDNIKCGFIYVSFKQGLTLKINIH